VTEPEVNIPLNIRRMEIQDLQKVSELDKISFSLPWPESSFKFEIEHNQVSRCWVAEIASEASQPVVIGMIVAWLIVDEVHIATLAVQPEYRKLHIAQQLLIRILTDGYRSGAVKAFLEVRKSNLAARSLYKKFGFVESGVRKRYYQDNGEDAVLMNLDEFDLDLWKSFG
jgi:ribosomal-protein-alanine N-acetyltransferase